MTAPDMLTSWNFGWPCDELTVSPAVCIANWVTCCGSVYSQLGLQLTCRTQQVNSSHSHLYIDTSDGTMGVCKGQGFCCVPTKFGDCESASKTWW